jgi:hypothetical protein
MLSILNIIKKILENKSTKRKDGYYIGIESRYNEYLDNPSDTNLSKLRYELTLVEPTDSILLAINEIDDFSSINEKVKDVEPIQQIYYWLAKYVELSNHFFDDNNMPMFEYWKGQVFGIVKTAELLLGKDKIDKSYYLNQLP